MGNDFSTNHQAPDTANKKLRFLARIEKMQIQQFSEDGKKIRNKPKHVLDMSKYAKMIRNSASNSRTNSSRPASSMIMSSEISSLADLLDVSSKISKWFEIGGAKIESVKYFEK